MMNIRIPQPMMMGAHGCGGVRITKKPFSSLLRLRYADMERYQPNLRRKSRERVPTVSLRNKTHMFAFVIVLCQFAMVDRLYFLPIGTMIYTLGFAVVIEIFEDQEVSEVIPWGHDAFGNTFDKKDHAFLEEQQRREILQNEYELARFEHHIMKRRPNTKFVSRKEDGKFVLYSI